MRRYIVYLFPTVRGGSFVRHETRKLEKGNLAYFSLANAATTISTCERYRHTSCMSYKPEHVCVFTVKPLSNIHKNV